MSKKPYDLLVFIGRFAPPHLGHRHVIAHALEKSEMVLVLVGSAGAAPSARVPFDSSTRIDMLQALCRGLASMTPTIVDRTSFGEFHGQTRDRLVFSPLQDRMYDDKAWTTLIQQQIAAFASPSQRIGLVGFSKDHTSYYLKMFPDLPCVEVEGFKYPCPITKGASYPLSSTDVRGQFAQYVQCHRASRPDHPVLQEIEAMCGPAVLAKLIACADGNPHFLAAHKIAVFDRGYRDSWRMAPYLPVFVTTDAVVTQSANLLLVQRRAEPGRGQWALPGGYLKVTDTLLDSCVRELYEEANPKLPQPILRSCLVKGPVEFDCPWRSGRGRVVTFAYHFDVSGPGGTKMVKLKGGDDAEHARWFPISHVVGSMMSQMFEDHWHIARKMTGGFAC